MKEIIRLSLIMTIILAALSSCASSQKRHFYGSIMTAKELDAAEILGNVEIEFESSHGYNESILLEQAYNRLIVIARKNYTGKVDIKNIMILRKSSSKNAFLLPAFFMGYYINMNFVEVYAKGAVIRYN